MNPFKPAPTIKEQAKQQQRNLKSIQRDVDREAAQLGRQEKDLEGQIKKAAAKGDTVTAKSLAKQLIKVRQMKTRSAGVKSQVAAVGHHTQAMATTHTLATTMSKTQKIMTQANKQVNTEKLSREMQEFQGQSEMSNMKQEMMDETLDGIMDDSEDEQEGEEIMNAVLDEIGIELYAKGGSVPTGKVGRKMTEEDGDEAESSDVQRRIASLKQ